MAKILVVDDDADVRNLYMTALESSHEIISAASGKEAWCLFQLYNFDLVITDFEMPTMNGAQLVTKIKEQKPRLPVIMTTGNPPEEYEADVLLKKPVSITLLRETVNTLLKG